VAIGAATPDRARVRREVRTGERVRGAFKTEPAYSEPFRCRFTPAQESESRSEGGVRRSKPATLLVSAPSLRAHGVGALKASDRVEITQLGALAPILMEVTGEPKPIRQRRTVIGYVASLSKVRDSEPPNVG
jgi:hypothetical protein